MKLSRALMLGTLCLLGLVLIIWWNYRATPAGDATMHHLDTILVLGYPADRRGQPLPEQRERVLAAVREYRLGVAPRMIVSGGAVLNGNTEAASMGRFARSLGVPAGDIIEEPQARNTIQNVFYAAEIMHSHGWQTVEVVSSPSHLPRAGLILEAFDREQPTLAIGWRTHAAQWPPEMSIWRKASLYSAEATYCFKLRLLGFPRSPFLPSP